MMKIKTLVSSIALATYGMGAVAQEDFDFALEEIIVTATKRAESLQDVPVAVTAFSADTILEAGINDASDLAVMTPSLNANAGGSPFTTRLTIRGIGTAGADPALEPSVGMFIDGVFMSRSGLGTSDLTDIERIEVLQGPQGTLYGKNANAGAISVITKRPNMEEFESYLETTVGNYGSGKVTATASGPLSDTLAYRLSGNMSQRDGYYDNGAAGIDDQNDADDWNLQGKLLWEPTERLSMLLSGAHIERDTACCGADAVQGDAVQQELINQGFSADKNDPYDYKTATSQQDAFSTESDLLSLHVEYDLGWGDITSITAWNDYQYSSSLDGDRSQLDILAVVDEQSGGDSFSQEFRLDASLGDNLDYQLGLFYYEQMTQRGDGSPTVFIGDDFVNIGSQQGLPFPFPLGFIVQPGDYIAYQHTWNTDTLALFGQATWHIGESWHVTGGLRWTDEEREAELYSESFSTAALAGVFKFADTISSPIDTTLNRSSNNVDWLAKLAYDLDGDSMVYASVSTGSKSGNFNGVSGAPDAREFDDEQTISYELGLKSTLLDSRLRINAAAFLTEVEDYQFQALLPTGLGTSVSNDGMVEVSGLDIQVDALPLHNLTLSAGIQYLNKYEVTEGAKAGQTLPYTAEYSGNLGATLVFPLADGNVFLRGDYVFMSEHKNSGSDAASLGEHNMDDREVLNLKVGWRNDNWNVSVWGKNLTDDQYAVQTATTNKLSGVDAYFLAPPKTYGATLRYDF